MSDALIAQYLDQHRFGPRGGRDVRAPRTLTPMNLELLEGALADPALVVDGGGLPPAKTVDRLASLMRMALWLRHAPVQLLPAELGSRAARFRFLVWTLPVRLGWPDALDVERVGFGVDAPGSTELGDREVLAEARAARTDWLGFLEGWEDDPWLAARQAADPAALEEDLRWVTSTWVGGEHPEEPLSLAPRHAPDAADHLSTVQLVVEQHWIARGAVLEAGGRFCPAGGRGSSGRWLGPPSRPSRRSCCSAGWPTRGAGPPWR